MSDIEIEPGDRLMIAADAYARAFAEHGYGPEGDLKRNALKEAIRAVTGEPKSTMPVFAIKAKDVLAQPTILGYAELAVSLGLFEHARETHHALNEIRAWQNANRDQVKIPDHVHVPADAS